MDQNRDALDGKKTVWEEISDGADMLTLGKRQLSSRSYVASFNLKGADQQKRVADLSGANGTASTWRSSSGVGATSSCSTSRRTTSTSTRSAPSRRLC